jgi:hypothetical protein
VFLPLVDHLVAAGRLLALGGDAALVLRAGLVAAAAVRLIIAQVDLAAVLEVPVAVPLPGLGAGIQAVPGDALLLLWATLVAEAAVGYVVLEVEAAALAG